jgi:transposase
MLRLPPSTQIFMASKPVDMRKGFDGLMAIIRHDWQTDVFSGHLFVFLGRSQSLVKILHWDRGGLVLYTKRLEQGKFIRPKLRPDGHSIDLDALELTMLLDGISVSDVKRPKLWEPPKNGLLSQAV